MKEIALLHDGIAVPATKKPWRCVVPKILYTREPISLHRSSSRSNSFKIFETWHDTVAVVVLHLIFNHKSVFVLKRQPFIADTRNAHKLNENISLNRRCKKVL